MCARNLGADLEVSEGKADLWPRSVFFLREPTRRGGRAGFLGRLSGLHRDLGRLDAGSHVGSTSSRRLHHHEPRYSFIISPFFLHDNDVCLRTWAC